MKVGFIDYYLDEWHANHYPQWLRAQSGGELEVAYAFAETDAPRGRTTDAWCAQNGIARCATIEELTEKSDAIVILSPDHCARHEHLCQIPLTSGKPCYVDKTFAPDVAAADRIFARADQFGTPCCSCSALRYADEYQGIDRSAILAVNAWGPGVGDQMGYEIYSIHQLEPVVMLMGTAPRRVMAMTAAPNGYLLTMDYPDGRYASICSCLGAMPFRTHLTGRTADGHRELTIRSDYFNRFMAMLARFLRTGTVEVPRAETRAIMATRAAGLRALQTPGEWIPVTL